MSGYIGYVIEKHDPFHADRIKAVTKFDSKKTIDEIPYAFPLMPKMLHIKPKVGEAVNVIIENEGKLNEQRYYIGPIISQPQKMDFDSYSSLSATKMLNGGVGKPDISVDNQPSANGTLPKEDEIAILGRRDSEIILGDNDVRIRCGVRVTDPVTSKILLNGKDESGNMFSRNNVSSEYLSRTAPAFIKLKEHKEPIETTAKAGDINPHTKTLSTATIVADKINLISTNGDGSFMLTGADEAITDKQMKNILEMAHKLPYGDLLCEFLSAFLKMFASHYHAYPGLPPDSAEPVAANFWQKYSSDEKKLENQLLSKDIGIN